MDQDETWHAGRPRPWPHCVRWRPTSPSNKGTQPPIVGPYLVTVLIMTVWILEAEPPAPGQGISGEPPQAESFDLHT